MFNLKQEDMLYIGIGGLVLGAIISRLMNLNIVPVGSKIPVTIQDVSEYAQDAIEKQKAIMSPLDEVVRKSAALDNFGNGYIQQVGLMDHNRNTVQNDYYVKINQPMIYHELE